MFERAEVYAGIGDKPLSRDLEPVLALLRDDGSRSDAICRWRVHAKWRCSVVAKSLGLSKPQSACLEDREICGAEKLLVQEVVVLARCTRVPPAPGCAGRWRVVHVVN